MRFRLWSFEFDYGEFFQIAFCCSICSIKPETVWQSCEITKKLIKQKRNIEQIVFIQLFMFIQSKPIDCQNKILWFKNVKVVHYFEWDSCGLYRCCSQVVVGNFFFGLRFHFTIMFVIAHHGDVCALICCLFRWVMWISVFL